MVRAANNSHMTMLTKGAIKNYVKNYQIKSRYCGQNSLKLNVVLLNEVMNSE